MARALAPRAPGSSISGLGAAPFQPGNREHQCYDGTEDENGDQDAVEPSPITPYFHEASIEAKATVQEAATW